jgi:hypothetical protein
MEKIRIRDKHPGSATLGLNAKGILDLHFRLIPYAPVPTYQHNRCAIKVQVSVADRHQVYADADLKRAADFRLFQKRLSFLSFLELKLFPVVWIRVTLMRIRIPLFT